MEAQISSRSLAAARATWLLLLVLSLTASAFAQDNLTQTHYRWRNNDAGEGTGPTSVDRSVAASSDDAEENGSGGTPNLTSSDLELTEDGTTNQQVGMRFLNVTVPQGATITNAYVQFTVDAAWSIPTTLTFYGEAIDSAPTFTTTANDITGRAKTAAFVNWANVPAWLTVGAAGPDQRTPDLSPVIQEVVNRAGWSSGNALVILVTGSGVREAESWDGTADPLLHVEYTTSGASWAASEDAKLFGLAKSTLRRVRFEISNEGVSSSGAVSYQLQVAETATCASGTYAAVPAAPGGHWQVIDSTFFADGQATLNVSPGLTDEAATFVAGQLKDAGNTTGGITLAANQFTEIEFSVQATTSATDGGDYCFRLVDSGAGPLDTYSIYAEVRLAGAAGGSLTLADHTAGQVGDKFTAAPAVADVLFRFNLGSSVVVTVDTLRVNFTIGGGVGNADVTLGELWLDNNSDGAVSAGDTVVQGSVTPAAGVLSFTTNFSPALAGSNYLVRATVAALASGDTTTFSVGAADVDEVEAGVTESGSISNATHTEDACNPSINYRSIGVDSSNLASAGTASVASGSPTVTFSGVSLSGNIGLGDKLTIGGEDLFILSVNSTTQVTLQAAATATHTNEAYTITRAFNTIADWELNQDGDLVAGNRREVGVAHNDGPFLAGATIDGSITDACRFMTLTVAPGRRHNGTAGTGVVLDGQDTDQGIRIQDDYTVLEWFAFKRNRGVDPSGAASVVVQLATNVLLQNLLIYDFADPANVVTGIRGQSNAGYTVRNSIIFNGDRAGIRNNDVTATGVVQNCTIYNMRDGAPGGFGVLNTAGTLTVTNTIAVFNDTDFSGGIMQSHNLSGDGTASCGACLPNRTPTANANPGAGSWVIFENLTAGAEDLHLKASSENDAVDSGTDLSVLFSNDVDEETRVAPWDRGADEDGAVNYRSIGSYSTGTASVPGSTVVTFGGGASLPTWIQAGDRLTIVGATVETRAIASRDSATQVTVTAAFGTHTDQPYFIGWVYTTGLAAVSQGSTTVVFSSGANLPARVGLGDKLTIGGEALHVLARNSATDLTLQTAASLDHSAPETYQLERAYLRLQDWETDRDGVLTADRRREVGVAYNDGPFTTGVRFQGSTTDTAHFMHLTVAAADRHTGIAGTGVVLDGGLDAVTASTRNIDVGDDYTVVDWFELRRHAIDTVEVTDTATNVLLRYLILHDFGDGGFYDGIAVSIAGVQSFTVQNSIIYDGTDAGIGGGGPEDIGTIENCTIYGMAVDGISDDGSVFTVRNTIAVNTGSPRDINFSNPSSAQQNNLISKATPTCPTCLVSRVATDLVSPPPGPNYVVFENLTLGSEDFHLKSSAENDAVDAGANLSARFATDIDGGARPAGSAWDIGADELGSTTSVELVSFTATGLDGEVVLAWETGSEMENLGFHLYRAMSEEGPYERITASLIPGLGSSPEGARYRYLDKVLANGVTYFYELEDIETTGMTVLHGPVSATPQAGAGSSPGGEASGSEPEGEPDSLITYGNPAGNRFTVLRESEREAVLELITEGFYAEPIADGTVRLSIPGFEPTGEPLRPAIPVTRPWVEALAGVRVNLVSVVEEEAESFAGLRPSRTERVEAVGSREGTVRLEHRGRRGSDRARVVLLYPEQAARVLGVGFQGEIKKARVELAPLRWDGSRLVLARRLVVRLRFEGKDRREASLSGARGRLYPRRLRHGGANLLARLVTKERGLHRVGYEEVLRGRTAVPASGLRLSRLGKPVAFHLEPNSGSFGPGSALYFLSEGADANPYGTEAVYEIELAESGTKMRESSASPGGPAVSHYRKRIEREVNRYYQAGLLGAEDPWLWDVLMSPVKKSYSLPVQGLLGSGQVSRLSVWLEGASDFEVEPDHHLKVYVNGVPVGEASFEGKSPQKLEVEVPAGALVEGENFVELENVGDTGARYSMVFLDRLELEYPRALEAEGGHLEGVFSESGIADVSQVGLAGYVLDVGEEGNPVWLREVEWTGNGAVRFRAEAGRRYMVVGAGSEARAEPRRPARSQLRSGNQGADYLVVGPAAFLDEAEALLALRQSQGLRVKAVSVEQVYEEFGFGEERPEAVAEFLGYAYHRWRAPAVRYVLLLGDATYDYKDYLGTGVVNRVPPLLIKTSYLWTASDPTLAAVNGDDLLPDVAIGRLPAANEDELRVMVAKTLAYESGPTSLASARVLVADNADQAGDFVTNAEEIAGGVLAGSDVRKLYLHELGAEAMRRGILEAFDEGASLMSYVGHGGIHLWAQENIFNTSDLASLSTQSQQPLLVTMNCLNGYFHFPYFNSLAEEALKAEGRGAIAAFSPSGLSVNEPAHLFHRTLLSEVFNGDHERLGDAVLAAQETYAASGAFPELLSIYHLLGDPALSIR